MRPRQIHSEALDCRAGNRELLDRLGRVGVPLLGISAAAAELFRGLLGVALLCGRVIGVFPGGVYTLGLNWRICSASILSNAGSAFWGVGGKDLFCEGDGEVVDRTGLVSGDLTLFVVARGVGLRGDCGEDAILVGRFVVWTDRDGDGDLGLGLRKFELNVEVGIEIGEYVVAGSAAGAAR